MKSKGLSPNLSMRSSSAEENALAEDPSEEKGEKDVSEK
jgi:hypothetical protein